VALGLHVGHVKKGWTARGVRSVMAALMKRQEDVMEKVDWAPEWPKSVKIEVCVSPFVEDIFVCRFGIHILSYLCIDWRISVCFVC
jgi:hypothetical protein